MTMKKLLILPLIFTLIASTVGALEMPRLFSDHMVLQRDNPIAIFGKGETGKAVQIQLSNSEETFYRETSVNSVGDFKVYLPAVPAGRGYTLQVSSGDERLQYEDILIGDVWICSGQSNMAWTLVNTNDAEKAIAESANQGIRLFRVAQVNSEIPVAEVEGGPWKLCDPLTSGEFSAVGYYFGKFLNEYTDVPIGLIHTNWGGTMVESWISQEALFTQPDPERFIQRIILNLPESTGNPLETRIDELLAGYNSGKPKSRHVSALKRGGGLPIQPSNLYNGMIHPLLDFPIKGAIWYQGESNAGRAYEYRKLMPLMIEDWRNQWNVGDFPFYLVQLANYQAIMETPVDSNWAELREAQSMTTELPNTGMAVIIDIGEENDIHPRNKRDVGYRLALQALEKTYGMTDLVASGPVLESAVAQGRKMRLKFSDTGSGLVLREQAYSGFELAEEDGAFHWAEAKVKGEAIILKSDSVKSPKYVRYAWANSPYATLFNKEGLPASPFRTDQRPGLTIGNRYVGSLNAPVPGKTFSDDRRNAFLQGAELKPVGKYLVAASGDDGNAATNAFDGNLNTRWSADGVDHLLLVDLGETFPLDSMQIATFSGDLRHLIFRVQASDDMESWEEIFFGMTSGTTVDLEEVGIRQTRARYLLFSFFGNTSSFWNSVTEIKIGM